MYASEAKKSEFLVHLDHFSEFLKYFKYFIADFLLKDAVLTVGVNLRLCLLSLWFRLKLLIALLKSSDLYHVIERKNVSGL